MAGRPGGGLTERRGGEGAYRGVFERAGAHLKLPSPAALLVTKLVKAALSKGDKKIWAGAGGVGVAGGGSDSYASQ